MQDKLELFVEKMKTAAGENLKSLLLYGSAAGGEFAAGHSDLNLLCVLESTSAPHLRNLHAPLEWWARQGQRPPLIFAAAEVSRTLDVFAMEWLDMKRSRRVLAGVDPLAALEVPLDLHRVEVERELRTQLLRLRQAFALQRGDKDVALLMANSVSTFAVLFRHVLIAMGEAPPADKAETFQQLALRFGFDAAPFLRALELRAAKTIRISAADATALFDGYQSSIARVVEEVDRQFQAR